MILRRSQHTYILVYACRLLHQGAWLGSHPKGRTKGNSGFQLTKLAFMNQREQTSNAGVNLSESHGGSLIPDS
jgi:hypothetical protein